MGYTLKKDMQTGLHMHIWKTFITLVVIKVYRYAAPKLRGVAYLHIAYLDGLAAYLD
jgi:hypothetical protein